MTVSDVKQQIQNNQLDNYYIFSGEELEVRRQYVAKIAEVAKKRLVVADKLSDVWSDIVNPSMFDDSCVYVVYDDKDLFQSEKLQEQIDAGVIGDNILIHLVSSVDKRTKWYKQNSDRIVLFEKYIRKQITLNNANCERLVAVCEQDYSRILLEIDKMRCFKSYFTKMTDDEVFEQLIEEGVIYQPPKDAIFDLVDAILKRQVNTVYDLLYQSYAVGEANMVILSVLYNNAKQVLQVQSCESSDICKSTGLTQWQVKCAKQKCNHYSDGELVNILYLIQQIQKDIITGQIEDKLSVEYLLVNIL